MKRYAGLHRSTVERQALTDARRDERAAERRMVELLETGVRADWALRA